MGLMRSQIHFFLALFMSLGAAIAQPTETPKIEKVSSKITVVTAGYNGLITIFNSEAGPVIVDTADVPSAASVLAIVQAIDPRPVQAVIVTHFHADHTGGLGMLAAGTSVYLDDVCLDSLRKLESKNGDPLVKAKSVVHSHTGTVLSFGTGNVRLVRPHAGHTAGDTVVIFEKEKVIAAGDLFFNGLAPYIDVEDGADTANWAETIESLCKQFPGFKVIPGHGPISDTEGWLGFAQYLRALHKDVAAAIRMGLTREQAMESVKLEAFTSIHDAGDFLTKKKNVGWVYDEMTHKRPASTRN